MREIKGRVGIRLVYFDVGAKTVKAVTSLSQSKALSFFSFFMLFISLSL